MNPLSRLSNKNARITAAYLDWKAQQGSALAWPKADQIALYCVAGVLAFFTCLYALPESEATVWIKTTLLYWTLTGIGACILAATALLTAVSVGRSLAEGNASYKARQAELAAIPEGETRQFLPEAGETGETGETGEWTYVKGMSPFLTPDEERAILAYPNPSLNLNTGGKVKACLAAGMEPEQIRIALKFSDTRLVGRYISCIKNPQKWAAAGSPIELEK